MESNMIYSDSIPETPRKRVHFARRDWLALLGAAVCAAGYAFGHPSVFITGILRMPGIGFTLSVWMILALCLFRTGTKHLRRSLFPLAAALLLSATYGIFADDALRVMNLPVLIGLTATAAYALSGSENLFSAAGLTGSIYRLANGTLCHLPAPFLALVNLRGSASRRRVKALVLGVVICIPVVGLAALLLCNADEAFSDALGSILYAFQGPNLSANMWNLIRFGVLTLLIFAFVYGLTLWKAPEAEKRSFGLSPLTLGMVLAALSMLYAAFLYIQFGQLRDFSGNYANSARAGFFQLVLVALITMLVALPALTIHPDSPAIRILGALATVLTMGIVASAVWRMALYIRAYGWTLLRMVTMWGILAITAAMIAALVKCVRPSVQVCRALAVFAIVTWILFNYTNVDARIAEYNIAAHRSGELRELDAEYLATLSPDALSALRGLADDEPEYLNAQLYGEKVHLNSYPSWYDWSLSWLKLTDSASEKLLGSWRLKELDAYNSGVYPSFFVEGGSLVLRDDGVAEFCAPDGSRISEDFSWILYPRYIFIESTSEDWWSHSFRLSGDTLIYNYDGLRCVYVREPSED